MSSKLQESMPAGYRLVASHYDGGETRHVIAGPGGAELVCVVAGGEDELRTVERFCQACIESAVTVVERPGKKAKP